MATLVLTVIGDDRAGLVNALAEVVTAHDGNWERSEMAELAGKFAGIVRVHVPDDRSDELIAALTPLHGMLDVVAHPAGSAPPGHDPAEFTLDLVGNDRTGIVQEVTSTLARHAVSITRFTTETLDAPMAGGRLFEAHAALHAPPDASLTELKADLERLAGELMVEIWMTEPVAPGSGVSA
jgi:glycine cleavage system regulatory protein